jgi:hypothetical protein
MKMVMVSQNPKDRTRGSAFSVRMKAIVQIPESSSMNLKGVRCQQYCWETIATVQLVGRNDLKGNHGRKGCRCSCSDRMTCAVCNLTPYTTLFDAYHSDHSGSFRVQARARLR